MTRKGPRSVLIIEARFYEDIADELARGAIDELDTLRWYADALNAACDRDIEVERINVRQAEYDLFSARGITDVFVGSSSYYEQRTVPVGSLLAGGANSARRPPGTGGAT